jgi:hypothetical protein
LINGDISNASPPRIIVLIDVVAESTVEEERKLLRSVTERKITQMNHLALSELWRLADRYGLSVELAAFETDHWTQEHLDKVMDKLDRRGGNPFNYSELYSSIEDFIGEIPYRNNLKGIVDLPGRVARYGSYGLELQNL